MVTVDERENFVAPEKGERLVLADRSGDLLLIKVILFSRIESNTREGHCINAIICCSSGVVIAEVERQLHIEGGSAAEALRRGLQHASMQTHDI